MNVLAKKMEEMMGVVEKEVLEARGGHCNGNEQ